MSVYSEESSLDLDHAEEMELLLDNYYMQVGSTSLIMNVDSAPFTSLYILNKTLLSQQIGKTSFFFDITTPQTEELGNKAGELKRLIDDSESVISINLDRWVRTQSVFIHIFLFRNSNVLQDVL